MSAVARETRQTNVPFVVALAVIQTVDTKHLAMAFRVGLEKEGGAADDALLFRDIDHTEHVLDGELVIATRILRAALLSVFGHIPLQARLDELGRGRGLENRRSKWTLDVTRR